MNGSSGAKQVAEKGLVSSTSSEEHPSGAEAHVDFAALAARLKRLRKKA
jgi:hypothetical protein